MDLFFLAAKPLIAILDALAYALSAIVGGVWYYLSGGRHT